MSGNQKEEVKVRRVYVYDAKEGRVVEKSERDKNEEVYENKYGETFTK